MRCLIPVILLCSINVFSQCDYSQNYIDKFTKNETKVTEKQKVNYPGFYAYPVYLSIASVKTDSQIYYFVIVQIEQLQNLICIDRDSKFSILTTDDDIFKLSNVGGVDCSKSGATYFNFKANKDDLIQLSEKHISALRLDYDDGKIDIPVIGKDLQKARGVNYFVNNVKCIL